MGQYYHPVNLDNKQWVSSHDFGAGLKLMEHSWVGNDFVGSVMNLMLKGGAWFKKRIVWAGDYYGERENEIDHFSQCIDANKVLPTIRMDEKTQKKAILVNHTKNMYVRFDEMPNNDGWVINPLPLLTALGNGRGGGDYRDDVDSDKVGIWAGDVLSIEMTVPKGQWCKKLVVAFKE
jgi:hypothetical protein